MKVLHMSTTVLEDLTGSTRHHRGTTGGYRLWGKRVLDVVMTLAMLPIALPIILLAWGVTVCDGGSGFYSQKRVGRHGRLFRCWKIRTMVRDADAVLDRLVAEDATLAEEWRRAQKLDRDPRITRLGRLLRMTSIDELPQLWNVLTGDMSLIGPRPFTPAQKPLYDRMPAADAYYTLRPGISGLWQVARRNAGTFDERARYDRAYADRLSFGDDMRILSQTVRAVLSATGK